MRKTVKKFNNITMTETFDKLVNQLKDENFDEEPEKIVRARNPGKVDMS